MTTGGGVVSDQVSRKDLDERFVDSILANGRNITRITKAIASLANDLRATQRELASLRARNGVLILALAIIAFANVVAVLAR